MSPEPKPAASTGQGWEGLNLPPEQEQAVADAAASYIASPLDTVPMPSPQLIETTYEVPVPTPHGVFGVRAWLFADGAEHITARALNDDGTPNEEAAFRSQVETHGTDTTLLVDTYDITQGVKTAIEVAGTELGAVRIDSGDLGPQGWNPGRGG